VLGNKIVRSFLNYFHGDFHCRYSVRRRRIWQVCVSAPNAFEQLKSGNFSGMAMRQVVVA
jgi:hypothetical protein